VTAIIQLAKHKQLQTPCSKLSQPHVSTTLPPCSISCSLQNDPRVIIIEKHQNAEQPTCNKVRTLVILPNGLHSLTPRHMPGVHLHIVRTTSSVPHEIFDPTLHHIRSPQKK
ncbi:hypothetical protein KC19_VG164700, partial [Ceratodon purpureus]